LKWKSFLFFSLKNKKITTESWIKLHKKIINQKMDSLIKSKKQKKNYEH